MADSSTESLAQFLIQDDNHVVFFPPKEAVVQYEQYEQEMQHLQELIEGAHREIEDKPVATSNIQELQAQISRHEVRQELG